MRTITQTEFLENDFNFVRKMSVKDMNVDVNDWKEQKERFFPKKKTKKPSLKEIRKWPKICSKERENGGQCSAGALNLRPTTDVVVVVVVVGVVRRRSVVVDVVEEKALQSAFQLRRFHSCCFFANRIADIFLQTRAK